MLGQLITGFSSDMGAKAFSALIGLCLIAAYRLLGAGWLIHKNGRRLTTQSGHLGQGEPWLDWVGCGGNLDRHALGERADSR
jgi:cytochrome d ubiquinol oxidase subunit II